MKALFFVNSLVGGGAERVCLNLAKQLSELNIMSDFVTVYNYKSDYDIPNYVEIFSLGIQDKILASVQVAKWVCEVNKFLAGKEYILITAHLPTSHFLASLTKVGKKCLYVMHVTQQLENDQNSWVYKIGLRLFLEGKKIVTVSQGLEKELINDYKINSKDVTTIYNPCIIEPLNLEAAKIFLHNRSYILFMGRLEEQKNPLLALDLYYRGNFYENYDFIYIGKGTLEEKIRQQITNYHLDKFVYLKGFQKNPEQWLMNASLLLSCSKQEGLPMNLIEALVCGTPVVASDCPCGPKEILTDDLARFLIYPEKDFDASISIIQSAMRYYPEITEKYYKKFDGKLIIQEYLDTWRKKFVS